MIHGTVSRIQTQHPEALILMSQDFNHATLSSHLTGFTQFDCKTLDLTYANIKNADKSSPLDKSDHNLVFLQPHYKPLVMSHPTTTQVGRKWPPSASEALKDCFKCTDWDSLLGPQLYSARSDIDRTEDIIADYINFCRNTVIPTDCSLLP